MTPKLKEGFRGQRMAVYSAEAIRKALDNPLTSDLVIHSMGYFPNAENHCVSSFAGSREYILVYCTKGSGYLTIDGTRHTVNAQQFFVIPIYRAFEMGSSTNNPWTIYWIHFLGSKANTIATSLHGIREIPESEYSRIADRINSLDEMLNIMEANRDAESVSYVNMCLHQLFASLLFIDTYREAKYRVSTTKQNSVFYCRTIHYMKENIPNRITISDMAQALGYSESYFYRLFYNETNQAPMTYFMNLKLRKACSLLQKTDLRVYQVAMKVGFDDSYYFSRFFKKQTGFSPKEYRDRQCS